MIDQINARLKAGRYGVSLYKPPNSERLWLVATLPPRPNSRRAGPYQQRIPTGFRANPTGYRRAESEAKILSGRLESKTFDWADYIKAEPVSYIVRDVVERYKADFFKGNSTSKRKVTWETDYQAVFKRLPQDEPLTERLILDALDSVKNYPRTLKKFYDSLGRLAKFIALDVDLSSYKSDYSPSKVNPRSLPSDQLIFETYHIIPNKSWQWVYGMLATFGLRPHEVFYIDHEYLIKNGICYVLEGKTVPGKVWPLYPEWVEQFDLKNISLPNIKPCELHSQYGHKVNRAFSNYNVPFNPYDLRHGWARRSIDFGLDARLAAKQMRHSYSVHTSTYNLWLDDSTHQKAFEQILNNSARPRSPSS